jgi:hypothetical protein
MRAACSPGEYPSIPEVCVKPLKIEFLISNIYKFSSYLTGNTLRHRYKAKPVNTVWESNRCLLWESFGTYRYTLWAECRVSVC